MRGGRASARLVVAVSGALLGVAGWAGATEFLPYFQLGASKAQRFEALASGPVSPGLSRYSSSLVLDDCLQLPRDPYALVQATPSRTQFFTSCKAIAADVLKRSPADSEAWLVAAQASIELGNVEDFRRELGTARDTAANVHWLAAERVDLAERHYADLGPADRDAHATDLRTLLDSPIGAQRLAERFVRDADVRERIKAVTEKAPEELQKRFLIDVNVAFAATQ